MPVTGVQTCALPISGTQCLDEDEFIDIVCVELEELCEKVYAGEIQDAKTVAAILAYANKVKE